MNKKLTPVVLVVALAGVTPAARAQLSIFRTLIQARDVVGQPDDSFGKSLAVLEDVDGDGVPDLAIGAPATRDEWIPGEDAGGVFLPRSERILVEGDDGTPGTSGVYVISGKTQALLESFKGPSELHVGVSVVALRAVGDELTPALAVGSCSDRTGVGYVRVMGGNPLTEVGRVSLEGQPGGAVSFGQAIASGGDVSGDGSADLVMGVPYFHLERGAESEPASQLPTGAIYVCSLDGSGLVRLDIPELKRAGHVGMAVEVVPDWNGDGVQDIAISCQLGRGPAATDAVAIVSVVQHKVIEWLRPTGDSKNVSDFGTSLCSPSMSSGNKSATQLLVGAPSWLASGELYGYSPHASISQIHLFGERNRGGSTGWRLGFSMGYIHDITGDGVMDIVVGAPSMDANTRGQMSRGAIMLCNGRSGEKLLTLHGQLDAGLGRSISCRIEGEHTTIAVGGRGVVEVFEVAGQL